MCQISSYLSMVVSRKGIHVDMTRLAWIDASARLLESVNIRGTENALGQWKAPTAMFGHDEGRIAACGVAVAVSHGRCPSMNHGVPANSRTWTVFGTMSDTEASEFAG